MNDSSVITPFTHLIRQLAAETKLFVRQEMELAKQELAEKAAHYRRNAIKLAVGGLVAYAGLIVLLGGLGFVVAFLVQRQQVDALLAVFVGLGSLGLLAAIVGFVLLMKGVKAISAEPLVPQRTLASLKHLRGDEDLPAQEKPREAKPPKRPAADIEADVLATEDRIAQKMQDLASRTSPKHVAEVASQALHSHPYGYGAAAFVTGLLSGVVLRRRLRLAKC